MNAADRKLLGDDADDGCEGTLRVEEVSNTLSDLAPALPGGYEVVQVEDDGVQIHEKTFAMSDSDLADNCKTRILDDGRLISKAFS